mgnify:CR=1 FL=1
MLDKVELFRIEMWYSVQNWTKFTQTWPIILRKTDQTRYRNQFENQADKTVPDCLDVAVYVWQWNHSMDRYDSQYVQQSWNKSYVVH